MENKTEISPWEQIPEEQTKDIANIGQTLSTSFSFPDTISREWIESVIETATACVYNGDSGPLPIFIKAKALSEIAEGIMDKVKEGAILESEKYGKEGYKIMGVKFQKVSGRRTFDFSNDKMFCEIKKLLKEREEFLKGIKKEMADVETGEIVYPPIEKYSGETIKLTII